MVIKEQNEDVNEWEILRNEIRDELEQTERELNEIDLMIENSQLQVSKLTQRNAAITMQLQQIQGQFDSLPRSDIRQAYDAAGVGMVLSVIIQLVFARRYLGEIGTVPAARRSLEQSGGKHAPLTADDAASTGEDQALLISAADLLANDTDLDGDTLSLSGFTQPAHGTLVDNGDGTFTYTPDANYNGADAFTYTITNGQGGSATATVNLTVNPGAEPPVISGLTPAVEGGDVVVDEKYLPGGSAPDAAQLTQPGTFTVVFPS